MMIILENFVSINNENGETPIWVEEDNQLYWVDAAKGYIFKYADNDLGYIKYEPKYQARALVRRGDKGWVIVTNSNGIAFWDEQSNQCELIVDPYENDDDMGFNDATADRQGRLLVNSFRYSQLDAADGSIYSLEPDLSFRKIDTGLKLPNGMGFSPDGKKLYVAEMFNGVLLAYDYDTRTGDISNRQIFAEIPSEKGFPDGLIVDAEGYVWTGHWGGWQVTRFSPNGDIDQEIKIPVEIASCMGFGGKDLNELFITTAWKSLSEEQRKEQPEAGDLFKIKLDIKGIPEAKFKG